jgi:hypothetical protein
VTRRRWFLLILGAVTVGVAVVTVSITAAIVTAARHTATIRRSGSEVIPAGPPVAVDITPTDYRIEYRVEERISGGVRVSTEKVSVRRPFESRLETWDGAPPGRTRVSTEIAALARSAAERAKAAALVMQQPPAIATADVRASASLPVALAKQLVQQREQRRVAGATCQVYRSAVRLTDEPFRPPTAAAYVDSCLDGHGLLVEEVRVASGKIDLHRVAVAVDVTPSLAAGTFAIGAPTVDVKNGGGSTRAVDPTTTPAGQFLQLDAPPAGFTLLGRYAVVPPQPENFSDPLREGMRRAAVIDAYVRGADAILIERGGTLRGQDPWTKDPSNPTIDAGSLGPAELLLSGRQVEVRVLTGGGHYLRIVGTLPPDDLAAIARQLHPVPGGTLKYLD